jgi:hypothetical protein
MEVTSRNEIVLFMNQLNKAVKNLQNSLNPKGEYAKVGLPEESGDHKDSGTPIVLIGAVHEFGIGVPMRSFLRVPIGENQQAIAKIASLGAKKVVNGTGKIHGVLKAMGEAGVSISKASFSLNDWEPLKDPTRGGKNKNGDAVPLVDTGTLRRSITYQIDKD